MKDERREEDRPTTHPDLDEEAFFLNEYEIDRLYGGPEEGGWWYEAGRFLKCHGVTTDIEKAEEVLAALTPEIEKRRIGISHPSSVISTGDWPVIYIQDHPGADYPETTPRYE